MSDNLQAILCDMCIEEDRKPALKTCMKCEISMCVQHLQAHLTTPVLLQTHPLTEPMVLCGTTKCPLHGKLLEYYCLDDMTCVCVSCAIEDQHRLHNMKTFSTAHKDLMENLKAEQKALRVKTNDENVSLEKWENSEREKLGLSSVRLIEAVTNLRDISLTSIQSSVSARMVSIKTSKSSIQAAQKEKDTFRFLQMYSQVHEDVEKAKAVDLRRGLEPGSERDKLVQEIRQGGKKMMEHAGQFWGSLLMMIDPENHQEPFSTSSDLTFDPQTLGRGMTLSKDNRRVFYSSWRGPLATHMLRFQSSLTVPNFHRWVISLSKDCNWTIGFCDKNYANEMKDGDVYGLRYQGKQLSSLTTEYDKVLNTPQPVVFSGKTEEPKTEVKKRKISLQMINPLDENLAEKMAQTQKVEVVWSFNNSLSFFSRIGQYQRKEIVTVKMSSSSWELAPFVCLEKEKSENSSNKSSASASKIPGSGQQQSQKKWFCSCGKVYYETNGGYSHGNCGYGMSSTCSCGETVGVLHITEVLCELL